MEECESCWKWSNSKRKCNLVESSSVSRREPSLPLCLCSLSLSHHALVENNKFERRTWNAHHERHQARKIMYEIRPACTWVRIAVRNDGEACLVLVPEPLEISTVVIQLGKTHQPSSSWAIKLLTLMHTEGLEQRRLSSSTPPRVSRLWSKSY